jgi:nucleoid-associated protein YgaU
MGLQRAVFRRNCGPMISAHLRTAFCFVCLPILLASCGSSPKVRGLPRNLPTINLHGSAQTPPHSMDKKDYPFDANGNYVTAWASEGRSASGESDYDSWRSSHEGSVSRKNPSPVKKVSSAPGKKSTSSSKSKGSASKTTAGSYTIKKGDTLGAIAKRNGTTVAKIKAANGMSSDFIREGKALKIPK